MRGFDFLLVSAHLIGQAPFNLGVILRDREEDRLHFRFLSDLAERGLSADDLEVLSGFPSLCEQIAQERGTYGLFSLLLDTLSHAIRVSNGQTILGESAEEAIEALYRMHVA
jgi:hypothetical protein